MKKKLITIIAAGALVLAACGSDSADDSGSNSGKDSTSDSTSDSSNSGKDSGNDSGKDSGNDSGKDSGSDLSGPQAAAAASAIAGAKEEGIDLDKDCVNELAAQLSDEDAQAIADAGPESDAGVSDEGTAIGTQLLGCADNDDIIDAFITALQQDGQEFDEDCVRDGLKDVDLAGLAASAEGDGGTPEEVINAVVGCFSLGS
jgi:clumping factor A